jgi:hypothetical protein
MVLLEHIFAYLTRWMAGFFVPSYRVKTLPQGCGCQVKFHVGG